MSNLAATVGDARKRLEAEHVDAGVRAWFAQERGLPAAWFDTLHPLLKEEWREAYEDEQRIMFGVPGGTRPTGILNPY